MFETADSARRISARRDLFGCSPSAGSAPSDYTVSEDGQPIGRIRYYSAADLGCSLWGGKPNARWSLDFVYDQFANGRRFRVLNIVDDVTKQCLGAIPDTSISGRRVARELTVIVERRGKPGSIVSDNGTEFTCNAMLAWCKNTGIDWHFIAPGKPIQNDLCRELQRAHAR